MFCTSQVSDLEYCDVFSLTIFFFWLHKLRLCPNTDKFTAYLKWGISKIDNVDVLCGVISTIRILRIYKYACTESKCQSHKLCHTLYSFTDRQTCLFNLCQIGEDKGKKLQFEKSNRDVKMLTMVLSSALVHGLVITLSSNFLAVRSNEQISAYMQTLMKL